jgi:hypothetical protein
MLVWIAFLANHIEVDGEDVFCPGWQCFPVHIPVCVCVCIHVYVYALSLSLSLSLSLCVS